jgi:transcriptional regulator with XRE-family HTH domain
MTSLAAIIRDARESAKLTEPGMARLVGIGTEELKRIERGQEEPSPALLDRFACTLGVDLPRFMAGEATRSPMRMLFRSMLAERRPTVRQLADTGAHRVLGDFVRCTAALGELRERLGERRDPTLIDETRPVHTKRGSAPPHGAEELAQQVREKLGLGDEPIYSMSHLVQERLGVDVLWVTPDELDRDIDAASVMAPGPAILVNLVGGVEQWWRTRMTLAHEVCHLLFDRDLLAEGGQRQFVLFSLATTPADGWTRPEMPRSNWYFSEEFERIEQRANAFAAYFLVPRSRVLALSKGLDPTSEEAIAAIGREHGVGRETAINLLTNVYHLPARARTMMATRPRAPAYETRPGRRFTEPADVRTGLRSGLLLDLVSRALAAGKIDRVAARDYLRWPLTVPLPPHPALTEALRAPLRTAERGIGLAAERHGMAPRADEAPAVPQRGSLDALHAALQGSQEPPDDEPDWSPFDIEPAEMREPELDQ